MTSGLGIASSEGAYDRPRLLIVEDEFLLRTYLSEELRAAGFVVVEAVSAEEAIAVLTSDRNFQVVVTDIRMGGDMDGIALANWIRHNVPQMKVAIASGNVELVNQAYDAVFSKPYDIPLIISEIRRMLAPGVSPESGRTVTWTLDANDVIIEVQPRSAEWLAPISVEDVIGTPLLAHVSGVSTAAFIRGILDAARHGNVVKIPYRCDTPERKRPWVMELHLEGEGRLNIIHRLVNDAPCTSASMFRTATLDLVDAIPRCSVCNRIFTNAEWHDADAQPLEGNSSGIFKVFYEICSACNSLALTALHTSDANLI